MRPPQRWVAAATLATGVVLLVAVTLWRVPLDPASGPVVAAPAREFFTAAQLRRGDGFASWARVWSLGSLATSVLLAAVLGFGPWGARLTRRVRGPWWWQVVVTVLALGLLGRVLTAPFAVLLWRRRTAYGLTEQGAGGLVVDLVRAELVVVVATTVGVLVLLGAARRWRRAWPAVAGSALAALVLVGSFGYPVLVEPLANSFTPLPPGPLRSGVLVLAQREGVQVDEVLVADASRRTTTINAYVSGIGATRRVVLYDTLVEDLPRDEALSVVGHELTHARHDDVLTGSLLGAAGILAAVGALGLLVGRRRALETTDVARVLALVAVAGLLVSPVECAVSRRLETRADLGALGATRDPAAFVGLQQQLALRSAADVTPPAWWTWWFATHPPVRTRIALALRVQDEGGGGAVGPRGGPG